MRVSELMIDDWVFYDDGNTKYLPQQIKEICGDEAILSCGVDMLEVYLKPIPLTEEILKLNDIIVYEFHDGYHFNIGKGMCVVSGIWFVHELQHALRLGGLSDLAKNFKIENSNNSEENQ